MTKNLKTRPSTDVQPKLLDNLYNLSMKAQEQAKLLEDQIKNITGLIHLIKHTQINLDIAEYNNPENS